MDMITWEYIRKHGGGSGSVTDEQIKESVENYFEENPVQVEIPDDQLKESVGDYLEENPIQCEVDDEKIKQNVEDYLEENPVQAGATDEQVTAINQNTQNILNITEAMKKVKYPVQYKGDVATYADLPTGQMTNDTIGYCYNCLDDGNNYAWAGSGRGENGDGWDNLGHQEAISNDEINGMFS